MKKQVGFIFLTSFALNYIWEHLHAPLYIHGYFGMVNEQSLLLSTFFDAIFITCLGFLILKTSLLNKKIWLSIPIGMISAIIIEKIGLSLAWWSYASTMPIIPLVETGVFPTIQLGILAYVTYRITAKIFLSPSSFES